jgi:hypothetical protein
MTAGGSDHGSQGFKPGNTNPDGSYKVGKGKPPEGGKFTAGDGRQRGRRKKGTCNLATDFSEELETTITLKVDGKTRKVTKQRAIMMRLMDNASRGQNAAIKTIMAYAERFGIQVEMAGQGTPDLSQLDKLSGEELDLLIKLLEKASGAECEDPVLPVDPFAYVNDPEDLRNYWLEATVEGLQIRRYRADSFVDRIEKIDNRAYYSAALPRRAGCMREHM